MKHENNFTSLDEWRAVYLPLHKKQLEEQRIKNDPHASAIEVFNGLDLPQLLVSKVSSPSKRKRTHPD